MDASASAGGGGPAPFLLKTYDMVDDSATDEIVSWSAAKNSFVVWNPPEFARLLLPTYFKHNNFSSFIRQLNTYGFRKIDPEKWEFANEEFMKDQKHLLKNIHRRKPIHSHSNNPQSSMVDPERAAFEEEIERLSREKASLEANVLSFRQQRSAEKLLLEDMMQRVGGMEQRQENLLTFIQKAVKNPSFAERLAHKIESMDFSVYNKKRRLPRVDHTQAIAENSFIDDLSASRPESSSIFHQDFSSKLRLELSPTVSDINMISQSTQSSNEGGGSPRRKLSQGDPKDAHLRKESILCAPETLELSDTGTSFTFRMDPSLPRKVPANDLPLLHVLQQGLTSNEEGDGHMSCQLNLTLASSSLQANRSPVSSKVPQISQEMSKSSESRFSTDGREPDVGALVRNRPQADEDANLSSTQKVPNNNPGSAAPPVRVNDVFWEQFLTERPGSSDNEEASSNYRANPYEEQEDRRSGYGMSRSTRNMEQLTL